MPPALKADDPVQEGGNSTREKTESSETPAIGKRNKETGTGTIPVRTPPPPRQMRHNISDEQLQMLVDCNRDGLSDVMNLAFGIGIGFLIPSGEAIFDAIFASQPVPISWLHIVELMLMCISFAVGGTVMFVSDKRTNRAEKIASDLRARHNENPQ